MSEIIQDIKSRGILSAYVDAPFDEGKNKLTKEGYRVISLEEDASLRIQEGKGASVSEVGNWVLEDIIYIPNKGKYLTKNSPIIKNVKEVIDCYRNGREFYLTTEQVEEALADSVQILVDSVLTKELHLNEIGVYAFGECAKDYGSFLKASRIKEIPISTVNIKAKPFARKVWFGNLKSLSDLNGNSWSLWCNDRVRGSKMANILNRP